MFFILIYVFVIILITVLQKKEWFHSVFKANKKVSWFISGLSLFMLYLSVDQGQLLAGIIAEHGMKGMWMVWAGWLGTFVVPIVFAPLWQKMDFMTDNQFLLFRFPGKSGRILHLFRATYVGGLVVSLLLCFHVLGFARVLQTFFNCNITTAIVVTGCILCLFALKNVLDLKLKMDAFHAFLYLLCLIIILCSLWMKGKGWEGMFTFFEKYPEKCQIFPIESDSNGWFSILVFVGVQWWSSYLFDGGGPEMARFTAVKGKNQAVFTGLFQIIISFILSFLVLANILLFLGISKTSSNYEIQYVSGLFVVVPEALRSVVLLGFFGMFISTSESLMNWGASFLTMDAYKLYINPKASGKKIRVISFGSMLALSLFAMLFALEIESLQSLVKITFSIAAGVAPVYILRWIWFRINAWSQLSAMISSAVFTLIYPWIHEFTPFFKFPLEESRILVVTILTTMIWLLTTFITKDQSAEVRLKMRPILESRIKFIKRFILALSLGFLLLCTVVLIWWITIKINVNII